jgi:glucose-6-phosphate 1-dehydrogenase
MKPSALKSCLLSAQSDLTRDLKESDLHMNNVIAILGASGDLTARKLIPALYNNYRKKRLPEGTSVLGFARRPYSDAEFRQKMKEAVALFAPDDFNEDEWSRFSKFLFYHQGEFSGDEHYRRLSGRIDEIGSSPQNCLFYLATAPEFYQPIVTHLAAANLLSETKEEYRRVIVEKPFGRDLESALSLNRVLHGVLQEHQIYRIDHYLGKETVQNVVVFRFGNAIFEPLWNRNYVDHVQITVAESAGVEHRANYYDTAGVLRDMFQNHLLQLLTLVAMEPPAVFDADTLRNEKVKVLSALREISPEHSARSTVRGQYEGYLSESGVGPHSDTETFAAVRLFIDNWRWQGVPFYLRSGKLLKEKVSEITVQFRRPPTQILDVQAGKTELFTNQLSIQIQPNEGMRLRFLAKVPDEGMQTRPVEMAFNFRESFGEKAIPEAYERLLLDALNGDASLFARSDEIELAWTFIDSIRRGWEGEYAPSMMQYKKGTWGPGAADDLMGRDGRWWGQESGGDDGVLQDPITIT